VITTTALAMACIAAAPSPFWAGPLSFGAPDATTPPIEQEVAPLGQSEETSTSFSIQGSWVWQLKADLHDTTNGRFSHDRGYFSARARIALSDDLDLLLGGRYQRDNFSFEGIPSPWTNVNTNSFNAGLKYKLTPQWQIFGGGQARWAAEEGASLGDGFEGGGAIGAAYAFSRDLVIGGGVGVRSQIEDDLLIYPIIVLDWKIIDRLSLSTRLTTGWSGQSGVELVYEVQPTIDVGMSLTFDYQRFRLSDDALTPGGVGVTEALPLTVFIAIDVRPNISLTAFVGATVYGRLKTTDSVGNDVWARNQDPAPVLGFQGAIRF
jgi:opacity protein-like surface antigen